MADWFEPVGPALDPPAEDAPKPTLRARLFWFVVLALAGLAAVAGAAYLLRALLFID